MVGSGKVQDLDARVKTLTALESDAERMHMELRSMFGRNSWLAWASVRMWREIVHEKKAMMRWREKASDGSVG